MPPISATAQSTRFATSCNYFLRVDQRDVKPPPIDALPSWALPSPVRVGLVTIGSQWAQPLMLHWPSPIEAWPFGH